MKDDIVSVLYGIRETLTPENLNRKFRNLHLGEQPPVGGAPAADDSFTVPESHAYYEMTVQLDKHTLIEIGDVCYDLAPGEFCIIPPGTVHRIKWGSPRDPSANMLWFSITSEIVRTGYSAYSDRTRSKIWGTDLNIPGNFLIGEIFAERARAREGSAEAIICYINAFLSLILQNVNFQSESGGLSWTNAMVSELKEYIHSHYSEELSLPELSARVCLSPNYLCKLFRQTTGETLTRYIRNLKIEKSIGLLADSSLSINEIAEKLGFCDQFYFSKVFKSFMCISPQQYRRSLKNGEDTEKIGK